MHCVIRYTLAVRRLMPTTSPNFVPYVSFLLSLETDALPVSVFKKCSLLSSQHAAIVGDGGTAVEEERKKDAYATEM